MLPVCCLNWKPILDYKVNFTMMPQWLEHPQQDTQFQLNKLFMSSGSILLKKQRRHNTSILLNLAFVPNGAFCSAIYFSLIRYIFSSRFGLVLASRAIRAAHCLTSIQVSVFLTLYYEFIFTLALDFLSLEIDYAVLSETIIDFFLHYGRCKD